MFKIGFFIDEIFKILLVFLISLVFFRTTLISFKLCLGLSCCTTLIICLLFFYIKLRKNKHRQFKKEQIKKIENIKLQLINASDLELRGYFKQLLNVECSKNGELIQINNEEKILFIPFFCKETLEYGDLLQIYKKNKNRKLSKVTILCVNKTPECEILSKNYKKIEYEIITLPTLFKNYIEPSNKYPNIYVECPIKEKLTLARLKKHVFNRTRVKSYILCGIVLLFSSYFVPLKIYYLIFSALLFIMSLCSLVIDKKDEQL